MSTLKVDRIEPFSGGQVEIQGLDISGYATTGSNTFIGNQTISGSLAVSGTLDLTNTPITSDTDIFISNIPTANTEARYVYNMDSTQVAQFIVIGRSGSAEESRVSMDAYYDGGSKGLGYLYATGLKGRVEAWDKTFEGSISIFGDNTGGYIADYSPVTNDYANAIKLQPYSSYNGGLVEVLRPLEVSGSATFNQVLELAPQDPLPAGGVGQLAVSGSNLYYHNGSVWAQIN